MLNPEGLLKNRAAIIAMARQLTPVAIDKVLKTDTFATATGIKDRINKVIQYNWSSSKLIRTAIAVHTYNSIESPENISDEKLLLIHVLALCNELVHNYFVILDDIEDGSVTRRGRPCWHVAADVGLSAVNDASLIRSFLYQILRFYCGSRNEYTMLMRLFDEAFLYTAIGQYLDTSTSKSKDYTLFTMDQYNTIARYKTANYSIKLPVMLGATLTNQGVINEGSIEEVTNKIGKIFQIQNDFEDVYLSASVGKEGTDIQERKCSWLAVSALQRCDAANRIVFTSCYGSKQPAHIERVKRLYDQLRLPEIYQAEHQRLKKETVKGIQKIQNGGLRQVLTDILNMICSIKI